MVSGKDDIKQAMEFLHQCDLIRIEDILPFFSDFVTIDHFKDAICNSLKVKCLLQFDYNLDFLLHILTINITGI